tara:strand:- start:1649 stop:2272 length:624 start_codon:yes stop_codon:yes gene_type:complete
MSVIGQEYKQPRVFAHDAWPVVTGAINYTWNTNSKSTPLDWAGILVTNTGDGGVNPYIAEDTITLSAGSGSVPGVLTVEAVDADGLITDWSFDPTTVSNLGAGYAVGDNLTQAGTSSAAGTGFTCTVTNIDIPNTQEAGCCLYIGRSGGFTSLLVIMEAGAYDRSAGDGYPAGDVVTLGSVSSGSILPISVKQITTVLALNEVIALY